MNDNLPEKREQAGVPAFERLSDLTPQQRQDLAEKCATMRLSGNGKVPYDVIANQLGLTRSQATKLCKEGFRNNYVQNEDDLMEVAGRNLARLEDLMSAHWQRARHDLEAYDLVLKNIGMINMMLGLEAPKRIHVKGEITHTGNPREDIMAILDRIEARQVDHDGVDILDAEILEEDD